MVRIPVSDATIPVVGAERPLIRFLRNHSILPFIVTMVMGQFLYHCKYQSVCVCGGGGGGGLNCLKTQRKIGHRV